jgi:hypothetical protein
MPNKGLRTGKQGRNELIPASAETGRANNNPPAKMTKSREPMMAR